MLKLSHFVFSILIFSAFTLTLDELEYQRIHKNSQILGECSSDKVNAVYLAINSC